MGTAHEDWVPKFPICSSGAWWLTAFDIYNTEKCYVQQCVVDTMFYFRLFPGREVRMPVQQPGYKLRFVFPQQVLSPERRLHAPWVRCAWAVGALPSSKLPVVIEPQQCRRVILAVALINMCSCRIYRAKDSLIGHVITEYYGSGIVTIVSDRAIHLPVYFLYITSFKQKKKKSNADHVLSTRCKFCVLLNVSTTTIV